MKIYSMISELAELVGGKIESGQYIHSLDRILRLYPWFNWSVVMRITNIKLNLDGKTNVKNP